MLCRLYCFLLFTSEIVAPGVLKAQAWDPAPLRTPTPTPVDGLPPERADFFNWLRTTTLTEQQTQKARERIYTYVSEEAKRLAGAFPPVGDSVAISLFGFAAQLGGAGADRVLSALTPQAPSVPVPPGLKLTLHPPLFSLGSEDSSWVLCYPYYFMAVLGGHQTPDTGVPADVAILSTLAAPASGGAGSSLARILVLVAAVTDSAAHVNSWLQKLDVKPIPPPTGMSGQWFSGKPTAPLRREAVVVRLPQRVVLLAYVGLADTFEANRPHFLNLLRTVAPNRCAN